MAMLQRPFLPILPLWWRRQGIQRLWHVCHEDLMEWESDGKKRREGRRDLEVKMERERARERASRVALSTSPQAHSYNIVTHINLSVQQSQLCLWITSSLSDSNYQSWEFVIVSSRKLAVKVTWRSPSIRSLSLTRRILVGRQPPEIHCEGGRNHKKNLPNTGGGEKWRAKGGRHLETANPLVSNGV